MSVIIWKGIQYNTEQSNLPKELKELLESAKKVPVKVVISEPETEPVKPKKNKRK
jgi:hypothetical protein